MVTSSMRAVLAAIAILFAPACATGVANAEQAEAVQQLYLFQYSRGPAWRDGVPMRRASRGSVRTAPTCSSCRTKAASSPAANPPAMTAAWPSSPATNIEEARAILAADPAITNGIFVAELRHWVPRFRTDDALPAGN